MPGHFYGHYDLVFSDSGFVGNKGKPEPAFVKAAFDVTRKPVMIYTSCELCSQWDWNASLFMNSIRLWRSCWAPGLCSRPRSHSMGVTIKRPFPIYSSKRSPGFVASDLASSIWLMGVGSQGKSPRFIGWTPCRCPTPASWYETLGGTGWTTASPVLPASPSCMAPARQAGYKLARLLSFPLEFYSSNPKINWRLF